MKKAVFKAFFQHGLLSRRAGIKNLLMAISYSFPCPRGNLVRRVSWDQDYFTLPEASSFLENGFIPLPVSWYCRRSSLLLRWKPVNIGLYFCLFKSENVEVGCSMDYGYEFVLWTLTGIGMTVCHICHTLAVIWDQRAKVEKCLWRFMCFSL